MASGLQHFVTVHRAKLEFGSGTVRIVHQSRLGKEGNGFQLAAYVAEKAPEYYRPINDLVRELQGGFVLTAFKETLARLPKAESFQSSHFGEIAAAVFAEEVLGLRRIYSKLSTLTAENANAYKMDLLLYDPSVDPVELVFGEVKSSDKVAEPGVAAGHDPSCYPSLFDSLREYGSSDLEFDLAAIKDRMAHLPAPDQSRLRSALMPYGQLRIKYLGFVVIDASTFNQHEARVLGLRKSNKEFDVDLICLEGYPDLAKDVFSRLKNVLDALRAACS